MIQKNKKINDFALRLIDFGYCLENCDKADLNDLSIAKEELIKEFKELIK